MLFNVPQYIDVEDKVAGPLTAKQLLWMFGMGAMLMLIWNIFDKPTFFVLAIPIVGSFAALAFYRPYGQPLISFIGAAILFAMRPKVYVWDRQFKPKRQIRQEADAKIVVPSKSVSASEVSRLAEIVDRKNLE